METKYHFLSVYAASNVARILSNAADGFGSWPQGELSPHLLEWKKIEIETRLDSVHGLDNEQFNSAAKKLFTKARGLHPLIRTRWGAVTGCTSRRYVRPVDRSAHRVQIHVERAQQLDIPDLLGQIGTGETFNPYADVLCNELNKIAALHNAMPVTHPIVVEPGPDYSVAEISVLFRLSGGQTESRQAFAALMNFVSALFADGSLERLIEQSCSDDILARAMLTHLHSFRTKRQLRKMPAGGPTNWNARRYGDLPPLSDVSAAQVLYESGLELQNWPYALMPGSVTKPWLSFLRDESINSSTLDEQKEADTALKRGLLVALEPDPIIRTKWGMLVLKRHVEVVEDFQSGMYEVTVHAAKAWPRDEDFHIIAGKTEDMLVERTRDLCKRSPDYPIDVEMEVGIGAGLVTLTCEFDPAAGEEEEVACRNSLRNYLFLILGLGILSEVLHEACEPQPTKQQVAL